MNIEKKGLYMKTINTIYDELLMFYTHKKEEGKENTIKYDKLLNTECIVTGHNKMISQSLNQVFEKLGHPEKMFFPVILNIVDKDNKYIVCALTENPNDQLNTVAELKQAIKNGTMIVTSYIVKDEQYANFMKYYKSIDSVKTPNKEFLQKTKFKTNTCLTKSLHLIKQITSKTIKLQILQVLFNKYMGAANTIYDGHILEQTMDTTKIPTIDINNYSKTYQEYYSDELTAIITTFFNQLNIKDQTQCVKLFTNNKNGKAMFQKAFQKYIEKENIENLEIE